MKNIKKIVLNCTLLIACVSCSTPKPMAPESTFTSDPSKQGFDVGAEDKDKFTEVDADSVQITPPALPPSPEVSKTPRELNSKKKIVKEAEIALSTTPLATPEFAYPEGYPEDYKAYDLQSSKLLERVIPKVFIGEELELSIRFWGVTVGSLNYKTLPIKEIAGTRAWHLHGELKSADFYSYVYSINDRVDTFVDVKNKRPIKFSLIQREKNKDIDDLQLFDHDKLKTTYFYKRIKDGVQDRDEKKSEWIPRNFQDAFSTMLFIRSLPLKKGEKYEFLLVSKMTPWLIEIEAVKEEKIEVLGVMKSALVLNARMRPFRKETASQKPMWYTGDLWVGTDEQHVLYKFQAKIKVGAIDGELTRFVPGKLAK